MRVCRVAIAAKVEDHPCPRMAQPEEEAQLGAPQENEIRDEHADGGARISEQSDFALAERASSKVPGVDSRKLLLWQTILKADVHADVAVAKVTAVLRCVDLIAELL